MIDKILVLYGYGLDIRISYGRLKIKHGFPSNDEKIELLIDKGTNQIEHIIVIGQTGAITFEAIQWIVAQNMMVTFFDGIGNVITEIAPNSDPTIAIKKRQIYLTDTSRFEIIHWLLNEKFKNQINTINYLCDNYANENWLDDSRKKLITQTFKTTNEYDITNVYDAQKLTIIESRIAFNYWRCLRDIPIKWQDEKKIPQNWKYVNNRKSPKAGHCYNSIDPFNSSLNYAYGVINSMIKLECIKNFIDIDLGISHTSNKYKNGLACDLIEPLRGKIDHLILEYFLNKIFHHRDFYETNSGECRINKKIITDIVKLSYTLEDYVKDVVFIFKKMLNGEKIAKKKNCIDCQSVFIPKSSYQKRCSKCAT